MNKTEIKAIQQIELTPEQVTLMNMLLTVYETVNKSERLFTMALIITGQAKTVIEAETILKGLKLFIASPYNTVFPEIPCTICGNYTAITINNEFFKNICHVCADKMKGEFFHITAKPSQPCKH